MKNKLNKLFEECKIIICKIIDEEIESFNISDIVINNKISSKKIKHIQKGLYLFYNNASQIVYIGQGGAQTSTPLKNRILQELKNYNKTDNGNNGATLSKNIQTVDHIKFDSHDDFRSHIKGWKIKILDSLRFDIHIDIIESICIELYSPKYNIKGKK